MGTSAAYFLKVPRTAVCVAKGLVSSVAYFRKVLVLILLYILCVLIALVCRCRGAERGVISDVLIVAPTVDALTVAPAVCRCRGCRKRCLKASSPRSISAPSRASYTVV